jgi:hypothetical protein
MQGTNKWDSKYLRPSIPHLITILVVLIGGYFGFRQSEANALQLVKAQNEVAAKTKIGHELWKVKYDAYQDALNFVTKYFYSHDWKSGALENKSPSPPPSPEEYGRIYSSLRLLTNNPNLLRAFLACLGVEGQDDGGVKKLEVKTEYFNTLVKIMREDLGAIPDPTPKKDFVLIDFSPAPSAANSPPVVR